MRAIEIKDLTFTYSKKTPFEKMALKNITFNVEEGETLGIIGQTGSGKSTLIQHLNGLIKMKNGEGTILGKDIKNKKILKELRFDVGMVFQYPEYQLFADTVALDVAFGPKNMKLEKDEIDRRVRRALDLVGLPYDKFAERSPFELSGGEKRRAAIAGVIAMEPKILVLDEPTAGLDPQGREEILDLIKQLKKEVSPTIIIVSHNMDEIAKMADHIIVMSEGYIIYDGTPIEVFTQPDFKEKTELDLPMATRIADTLQERGINIPDVVTVEALVEELAKLKDHIGVFIENVLSQESIESAYNTDKQTGFYNNLYLYSLE